MKTKTKFANHLLRLTPNTTSHINILIEYADQNIWTEGWMRSTSMMCIHFMHFCKNTKQFKTNPDNREKVIPALYNKSQFFRVMHLFLSIICYHVSAIIQPISSQWMGVHYSVIQLNVCFMEPLANHFKKYHKTEKKMEENILMDLRKTSLSG
jgi:hypothetical protein